MARRVTKEVYLKLATERDQAKRQRDKYHKLGKFEIAESFNRMYRLKQALIKECHMDEKLILLDTVSKSESEQHSNGFRTLRSVT